MVEARLIARPPAPRSRKLLPGSGASLLLGTLVFGFLFRARPEAVEDWWYDSGCTPSIHQSSAITSLKTITTAQADFRVNDRDRDGVVEYWRADLSGLYTLHSKTNPTADAIKLIELSVACADDRPVTDITRYGSRASRYGYWFRALLHEEEATPAPDRYAACAFPVDRAAGKWTFITDETSAIWRKNLKGRRGVDRFPRDPRQEGWARID